MEFEILKLIVHLLGLLFFNLGLYFIDPSLPIVGSGLFLMWHTKS